MFVLIGYVVVIFSVLGGFAMAGGHLAALFQPLELLMIGGAAIGAFIVANNSKVIKATLKKLGTVFKGSKYNKTRYLELLSILYSLFVKARKEGLMAIESDVDTPEESKIFSQFPEILNDHHVIEFITDYLRMIVGGNLKSYEIEALMDSEIETHHHEAGLAINAVTKIADAMPAFGIVAAVMGVVHTMESIGLPPGELGILIAHALVGTFLGILLGYGFIGPLASLLEQKLEEETKVYQCIKATLIASVNGYLPQTAVEFGRKVLFSTEKPSNKELEEAVKELKSKAAG